MMLVVLRASSRASRVCFNRLGELKLTAHKDFADWLWNHEVHVEPREPPDSLCSCNAFLG